jgi:hypothetical protein
MAAELKLQIPVLTDAIGCDDARQPPTQTPHGRLSAAIVEHAALSDREALIAELQTQIAAGAFALTDDILRTAFAEMEAAVFGQISGRLRRELPEMIDTLLRERLGDGPDTGSDTDD